MNKRLIQTPHTLHNLKLFNLTGKFPVKRHKQFLSLSLSAFHFSFSLSLAPPTSVEIMAANGTSVGQNALYGPLSEGSDLALMCVARGGKFWFWHSAIAFFLSFVRRLLDLDLVLRLLF